MRTVRLLICLLLFSFILSVYADEDLKFPVYNHISDYGYTNTWFVPMSRLEKLPKWNEQGEPPLSVGKAKLLAKAWIVSKGLNTNCYVSSIEFRSIGRGPTKFRPYWFYIVHFEEVATVGSWATCVVLSDGSIVEPDTTPLTKNIVRYLD